MKFSKDILVMDFEGFLDPVQLGAVLLDKDTLVEKGSFSSYIYVPNRVVTADSFSGITQEMLEGAPSQAQVAKMLFEKFGTNVFLSSWTTDLDMRHFKTIIQAAGIAWKEYDYHVLDLWPVAYIHLLKQGYTGGIRSEEIFKAFGAKPRGLHDALEDCRIAADVLRKVMQ